MAPGTDVDGGELGRQGPTEVRTLAETTQACAGDWNGAGWDDGAGVGWDGLRGDGRQKTEDGRRKGGRWQDGRWQDGKNGK